MHKAKTCLSRLVKAVEQRGETVIVQRNGKPVAHILTAEESPIRHDLTPDPRSAVRLAPNYDTAQPLSDKQWQPDCR